MRIFKNLSYLCMCTAAAWILVVIDYRLLMLFEDKVQFFFTMAGLLLISLVPALILTAIILYIGRRFNTEQYRHVPLGFLFVGILHCVTPIAYNTEIFDWYFKAFLAFGAFLWTIIYCIFNFALAICKNRKILKEISAADIIEEKTYKGEN